MISDERLAELIHYWTEFDGSPLLEQREVHQALRELQQWRSGVEPKTGSPIGHLVVMEPWTDETE